MKIVIIAQEFSNNGGAEKAAAEHYRLLMEMGNDVSLIGDFSRELPHAKGLPLQGFRVSSYAELQSISLLQKVSVAVRGLFNVPLFVRVFLFLAKARPDIVHLHKVKQLSPLLYLALKLLRLPTVATIHDHYLTCLNSTRIQGDGSYCQLNRCSFRTALQKKCVGNSRAMTAYSVVEFVARRQIVRDVSTVDTYVFPSEFLSGWTSRASYPISARVVPNFANDVRNFASPSKEGYVLYFGRLSEEKGVTLLPELARRLPNAQIRVIGGGPLRDVLEAAEKEIPNLEVLGPRYGEALSSEIAGASVVLLPSVCFENAPLSILEAFMHGKPVVASNIGGIPELVTSGKEGFLFPPGDCAAAATLISNLVSDSELRTKLGRNARDSFVGKYGPAAYFANLTEIYTDLGSVPLTKISN